MYKHLTIVLSIVLLVLGSFYLYERYSHASTKADLYNQIAELEGLVQETETAYSKAGVKLENLESKNRELQQIIEDRDEEVAAITQTNLKLKDVIAKFDQKNETSETIVNESGEETTISEECSSDLENKRFRVEFNKSSEHWKFSGHTLTNPSYAEVMLSWVKPLKLEIVLTKDANGRLKTYIDSEQVVPTEVILQYDDDVFKKKWYEKIGVGLDLGLGDGFHTSLRGFYEFMNGKWLLGPYYSYTFDGNKFRTYYGLSVGYYIFR